MGKMVIGFLLVGLVVGVVVGYGIGFMIYQPQVSQLYSKLSKTELALSESRSEAESLRGQLTETKDKLATKEVELTKAQSTIMSLEEAKRDLETKYTRLSEQYEIIYDSRYKEGYDIGYIQGITDGAGRGYSIRDPAYSEALRFISSDRTDRNQYIEGNYTCLNFAADFKNNAFKAGYRCGFVYIAFPDSAHAIVCFNTTDKGVIFVETQDDELVELIIGERYFDRTKYIVDFDDTIVWFLIIW